MKRIKLFLIIIFTFFGFASYVNAGVCDSNHIKQLKSLAEQVDISYEYLEDNGDNNDGDFLVNVYSVSVNLISDELYINHDRNNYYYESNNGGLVKFITNSGKVKLNIYSSRCQNYLVKNIYLDLPKFNVYSYKEECKTLSQYNLDVCDKWYQGTINDNIFYKEVNKYLNKDTDKDNSFSFQTVIDFLGDNYLIVGGVLVFILMMVLAIIIYRKRSVLE